MRFRVTKDTAPKSWQFQFARNTGSNNDNNGDTFFYSHPIWTTSGLSRVNHPSPQVAYITHMFLWNSYIQHYSTQMMLCIRRLLSLSQTTWQKGLWLNLHRQKQLYTDHYGGKSYSYSTWIRQDHQAIAKKLSRWSKMLFSLIFCLYCVSGLVLIVILWKS